MNTQSATETKKQVGNGDLYFCPNGHQSESFSRKTLSDEKKKSIKKLYQLDKRWNWIIPFHFLLWIGSGIIAIQTQGIWADIICACIGGIGLGGLAVLVHESSHSLFTHKRIDRWIGFLCGLPILVSANTYKLLHMNHHKFVRTEDDPDDIENMPVSSHWLPIFYILILFVGAYLYIIHVPISAWKISKKNRRSFLAETLAVWLFIAAGWVLLPSNVIIQMWLLPLIVGAQIVSIRSISEHGLTSTGNEFVDTRTVLSNPAVSFLGCNVNYHLEHHLYPGIPWYNLPRLHFLLKDEFQKAGASVYGSYTEFYLDLFKVFRDGIRNGTMLIPEHLREQLCI